MSILNPLSNFRKKHHTYTGPCKYFYQYFHVKDILSLQFWFALIPIVIIISIYLPWFLIFYLKYFVPLLIYQLFFPWTKFFSPFCDCNRKNKNNQQGPHPFFRNYWSSCSTTRTATGTKLLLAVSGLSNGGFGWLRCAKQYCEQWSVESHRNTKVQGTNKSVWLYPGVQGGKQR